MALKDSLLSRLFGGRHEESEEPEQDLEETPAATPPPPPPEDPIPTLHLALDHSIYQLWSMRSRQAGWLPRPELRLEPPGTALSDEELKKEVFRLQMTVNSTSNGRLLQVRNMQKAAETNPNAPPIQLDAQAVVFTSANQLAAWLLVYPPVGEGKALDRDLLDRALKDAKVAYGLDEALLDALPSRQDRYFRVIPIAAGEAAVHGVDGRVVDHFSRSTERKVIIDKNDRVDYTTLDFVHNVEEGGVICEIIPPTQGTPGHTVLDREIPARDGRPAQAPSGRNTQLNEDGTALVATIAGHVEFSGRSFQVKPLLDIPGNVDFSSGNINFLGDVHVRGDIRSGFTVRAMGSITVDGVVEACTVEAGGDLLVAGGVQGDNQAVIRAQRSIFAKYLENASVYAKDSLHTDCIINCNIYCDNLVEVRSGRMTIIGGTVRAAHEVSAGTIGSRVEPRTDVILGGQPCVDFDHDILTQEIARMEADLGKAERQPNSPDKRARLSKLRMQLMVDRKKLDQIQKEKELLAAEPEETGVCRMVCNTVYPNTVLTIGPETYRFEYLTHPCLATLVDREISLI